MLSGAEKVAILMRILDDEAVAEILNLLGEEEVKTISKAIASLGQVPSDVVEKTILEFIWQINESVSVVGNKRIAHDLLEKVFGEIKALEIIEEIKRSDNVDIWQHLETMDIQDLTNFIKREHPQTAAAILSLLPSPKTALILSLLQQEYAFEIVKRILAIDELDHDTISKLEQALHTQFPHRSRQQIALRSTRNNHRTVAGILESINDGGELFRKLENYDSNLAENIRKMMFSFSDIGSLDYNSVQTLIQQISDKGNLAIALKGSDEKVRMAFTSSMSQRAAKLLLEEISSVSASPAEVKASQQQIVSLAKELISSGAIILRKTL